MTAPRWLLPALPALPYLLVGTVVVGAALWLRTALRRDGQDDAAARVLAAHVAHDDSVQAGRDAFTRALLDRITTQTAVLADALTRATQARGTARTDIAASDAAPADLGKARDAVRSCTRALVADSLALARCQRLHVSKDSAIDTLTAALATARTQRARGDSLAAIRAAGPRVRFELAPLYDVGAGVPVLQGGATWRVLGRAAGRSTVLLGQGETVLGRLPAHDSTRFRWRVGGRLTF